MNFIIEQLKDDHRQLVRILNHLEREMKAYTGLLQADSSLETILDILDYIQVYPEIWHHPTEDVIYDVLKEKDAESVNAVTALMAEHSVLELLTENLQNVIECAVGQVGPQGARAKMRLVKATSDYINRQLRHMEQEQKLLFPLIEQLLESEDWVAIKARIKNQQYLIEEPRIQNYQNFYQSIAGSSIVTSH